MLLMRNSKLRAPGRRESAAAPREPSRFGSSFPRRALATGLVVLTARLSP
jgi:hypothetical protein